jgi:hypothetical protein
MAKASASGMMQATDLWKSTERAILLERLGMEQRAKENFDMAFGLQYGLAVWLVPVGFREIN